MHSAAGMHIVYVYMYFQEVILYFKPPISTLVLKLAEIHQYPSIKLHYLYVLTYWSPYAHFIGWPNKYDKPCYMRRVNSNVLRMYVPLTLWGWTREF